MREGERVWVGVGEGVETEPERATNRQAKRHTERQTDEFGH